MGVPAAALADDAGGSLLGDVEFRFMRDFVYRYCGIALNDQKRQLVQGRLQRRLRALGMKDFASYCELLRNDPQSELDELSSVISTNVTSFFRENHHFEFLQETLLPALLAQKRKNGGRLRLWSAGCSTGEEPYSLAMVLAEALERGGKPVDAKILATDLSPQALAQARQGVYALDRLNGVSEARRKRWFLQGTAGNAGEVCVHPRLRELVTIMPLNLLHDWPMKGPFDIIFCRNVIIYFDQPTKKRLFARYAEILSPGGHLFLGHSESMHGLSDSYEMAGRTTYRKRA